MTTVQLDSSVCSCGCRPDVNEAMLCSGNAVCAASPTFLTPFISAFSPAEVLSKPSDWNDVILCSGQTHLVYMSNY